MDSSHTPESIIAQTRLWIKNSKIKEAFQELEKLPAFYDEFIQLSSRWKDLHTTIHKGTLKQEDFNTEKNRIIEALLFRLSDLEKTYSTKPVVPIENVPPLIGKVFGRDNDVKRFIALSAIDDPQLVHNVIIARGWPGVGKTTFATYLTKNKEIQHFFSDGIYWVSMGDNPTVLEKLLELSRLLKISLDSGASIEMARSAIQKHISRKHLMIIVDDVWETGHGSAFKFSSENSLTFFTTRFQKVARELAIHPTSVFLLGQLEEEQSLALFNEYAPAVVSRFSHEVSRLISDLEGLPLALKVAARLLETDLAYGFDIADLFTEIEQGRILHEQAPDDRYDPETGTIPTVSILLKKSTDRLNEDDRLNFAFLGAAFVPKPATFSLAAIEAVWEVDNAKESLKVLIDRGLLEPIPKQNRYQMHSLLVMHAKSLLEKEP